MKLGRLSPRGGADAVESEADTQVQSIISPTDELEALNDNDTSELSHEWAREHEAALIFATRWLLSQK